LWHFRCCYTGYYYKHLHIYIISITKLIFEIFIVQNIRLTKYHVDEFKVQRGLSCWSEDARIFASWVVNLPGAMMLIFSECYVLHREDIWHELISRPVNYRLRCVVVCDLESKRTRRPFLVFGRRATKITACTKIKWRLNPLYICTQRGPEILRI
jgi:hypothetical protein